MEKIRFGDMDTLQSYADLLNQVGHHVKVGTWDGFGMNKIKLKATRHIFYKRKKNGHLKKEDKFDAVLLILPKFMTKESNIQGFCSFRV